LIVSPPLPMIKPTVESGIWISFVVRGLLCPGNCAGGGNASGNADFSLTNLSAVASCSCVPGPRVTRAGCPPPICSIWMLQPASVVMALIVSPPLPINLPTQESSTDISLVVISDVTNGKPAVVNVPTGIGTPLPGPNAGGGGAPFGAPFPSISLVRRLMISPISCSAESSAAFGSSFLIGVRIA